MEPLNVSRRVTIQRPPPWKCKSSRKLSGTAWRSIVNALIYDHVALRQYLYGAFMNYRRPVVGLTARARCFYCNNNNLREFDVHSVAPDGLTDDISLSVADKPFYRGITLVSSFTRTIRLITWDPKKNSQAIENNENLGYTDWFCFYFLYTPYTFIGACIFLLCEHLQFCMIQRNNAKHEALHWWIRQVNLAATLFVDL